MPRFRAVILLAVLCASRSARAQDAAVATRSQPDDLHAIARLFVNGTEPACPSGAELAANVNRLLGRTAIARNDAIEEEVRVYWQVAPLEKGTVSQFRLVTRDGRLIGTRVVRSPEADCVARRETAALILAVMLDLPRQELLSEAPAAPSESTAFSVAVGSTGSWGWLPRPRLGLDGAASLRVTQRLWPGIGFLWFPATHFATSSGNYRMGAWLVTLGASLALWEEPSWRFSWRAGIRAGVLRAEGLDFPVDSSTTARVVDFTTQGELAARVAGPVWLAVAAGAGAPVVRPRVLFLDADGQETTAHRAGRVHGLLTISLVVHQFP